MSIDPQLVKQLREKTGAGMMDCKKALLEGGGSLPQAVEILRKQGLASASRRETRVASEGITCIYRSDDARLGVILELNCETDFVAKNEDFKKLAEELVWLIAQKNPADVSQLEKLSVGSSGTVTDHGTVADRIHLLVAKVGEKISLRRFHRLTASPDEKVGGYVHLGAKIGVLIRLKGQKLLEPVLKDIAMHVAAAHPHYLNRDDIPPDVAAREKDIYFSQIKDSGKPEAILDKIVEGKVAKFASEVCLNEQVFIKDPTGKKTVAQVLKEIDPTLAIVEFVRYQVGEGIEKKKEDFATEVKKMVS